MAVLEVMGTFVPGLLQHCRALSLQDPEQLWVNAACFEHTHLRYVGKLRFLFLCWLYLILNWSCTQVRGAQYHLVM